MGSLTEVYEGGNGASLRRLYAGVALFGVGAVLVLAAIIVASTSVGSYFGLDLYDSRELAGVLGGVGFPALLVGTITVLPKASRRIRAAGAAGAVICLAGVVLFRHYYPVDWVGTTTGNPEMTLVVAGTYVTGALLTTWSLFTAVANFKTRNDPGGTVRLEIMKDGETRVVEVSDDRLRGKLSGIGMLGGTPDGDVDTQTNRGASAGSRATNRSSGGRGESAATSQGVTDGGATTDDAEFLTPDSREPTGDAYCGNCSHFQYVRSDGDIEPYCGYHGELMDDMDACGEWTSNTGR